MPMVSYISEVMGHVQDHLGLRLEYAARTVRDYIRGKLGGRYRSMGASVSRRIAATQGFIKEARTLQKRYKKLGWQERSAFAWNARQIGNLGRKVGRLKKLLRSTRGGHGGSPPGEYPGMRTGQLRRNVQQETDRKGLVARVGTNVVYGKWLELGTRKMAARPWLSRGMIESRPEVERILSAEIPGGKA